MNQAVDTTPQSPERTVFLSFTSLDRETARTVVNGLKGADVDVWWDEGGIGWGDDWQTKLQQALGRCGAYVILLGSGGVRRWVKPELGVALKRHVDDGLPILPLLLDGVAPEELPPFLSLFQARPLPADLKTFDFSALALTLREAAIETVPVPRDVCPFPGLEPFDENTAEFFLGRQADTLALLERLGRGVDGVQRRWLQVEGPSGVGKSSLVRAGLIPAVRGGWAEEGEHRAGWTVVVLRPGGEPLEALAAALERALAAADAPAPVYRHLDPLRNTQGKDEDLRYLLKVAFPEHQRLLLVIDQFEELFTLNKDLACLLRIDALLATALEDPDGPLYLVTTIRSDFLLRIGELPRLQGLLNSHAGRYDLQPLDLNGLREVVRLPARRAGLRWGEQDLPERIVEEAVRERAPLPLVANLLRLLWEDAHWRGDHELRAADYRALNGVAGALAKSADRLLNSLGEDGMERARSLLLALVVPGRESQDTKRPISRDMALRAAGGGPEAEQVLNRLSGLRATQGHNRGQSQSQSQSQSQTRSGRGDDADPRLVVVSTADRSRPDGPADQPTEQPADRPADQPTAEPADDYHSGPAGEPADSHPGNHTQRVDLAHEALLRLDPTGQPYWQTLRGWVDARRQQLEDRDLLERLAIEWAEGKAEPARGRALRGFRRLKKSGTALSDPALRYIKTSWWRALRRIALAMAGGLAVVGGLAAFNLWIYQQEMSPAMGVYVLAVKAGWVMNQPEMIPIRPGQGAFPASYWMGSADDDELGERDERPRHQVTLSKPFAIGRYEVTFQQYELFAHSTGRVIHNHEGWGKGDHPIINVSWEDAKAYADWLSERTDRVWRLPSEAEWEYVARAGTTTRYWWGNEPKQDDKVWANCDGCGSEWDSDSTAPVGSFAANPFGLHGTAGNVWEWVEDCSIDNYDNGPTTAAAREQGEGVDCGLRVVRGGSWSFRPVHLRSAVRDRLEPDYRNDELGFRLAQDL